MLKVTISGAYRTNDAKVLKNYSDVVVTIPEVDEALIQSAVMYRMLPIAFEKEDVAFVSNYRCDIDKIEKDARVKESFAGKCIKELDWVELQLVAIKHNLRSVPLYKDCNIKTAKIKCLKEYSVKVLGEEFDDGLPFADMPSIVLPKGISETAPKE